MSVEELNAEIAGEVDRLATAAKDAVHAIIDTYEASKTATTEVPAVDAAAAEPATGPVAEPEPEAEAATEDTGTATPAAETAETGAGADPSTVKWND